MTELNARIRERREALHMTLEDVGRAVGVSKSTVLSWETGRIKEMRRDKLRALAQALQTTVDYLMGLTDDPSVGIKLTQLETELYRQALQGDLFDALLFSAGFQTVADEDANVTIYSNDYILNKTPELVEKIMSQTLSYFSFLLKQEANHR